MKSIIDLINAFFKIIFPLYLLLIFKFALIGSFYHWGQGMKELKKYSNEAPILVGIKVNASNSYYGMSMEYILWPSVLKDFKSVIITKASNSDTSMRIRGFGFLIKIFWIGVCFIGTWFSWFGYKRLKKWAKSNL